MSIKNLIDEIKSEGILRAGHKLEKLYDIAHHNEQLLSERDARIAALEAERDALAAENAIQDFIISAVKELVRDSQGVSGWHLNGDVGTWEEVLPELNHSETPATDAFLREQMAKGVEMFAAHKREWADHWDKHGVRDGSAPRCVMVAREASEFAAQLRAGEEV